jgi:hypothetical protein
MSKVTPIQARDFYRAAATFYRQASWRSVGGDEPIKIRCEQIEGGRHFAIVLGKKGKVKGLRLCDDWRTCFLFEQAEYRTIAEQLRFTALHFGNRTEVSPNDLKMAERHGFEVAGPRAFPVVLRKEPSGDFRSPDAGELEVLEACLGIIPDFLKRAEDRKPDVYEYTFNVAYGQMTLDLSWVPIDRLSVDWAEKPS